MKVRRGLMLGATAVAVFMVSFSVAGCGDNPVAPLNDGGTGGFTFIKDKGGDPLAAPGAMNVKDVNVKDVNVRALPLVGGGSGSAVIGPAGGAIDLTLGPHACTFLVPPRAVLAPVLITVVAVDSLLPGHDVAVFDFGPDGLAFQVPAKLTLQVSDPEGTMKQLYWWNPSSGRWQLVNVAPVKGGVVTFNVAHFSKYGIT